MGKYRQNKLRVAAIQLASGLDRDDNLQRCESYLHEAACEGAEICVLPELFSCLGPEPVCFCCSEPSNGPLVEWGKIRARQLGCWIVMGSFMERQRRSALPYNTCCIIDQLGCLVGQYRKIHLFDSKVPDADGGESAYVRPGKQPTTVSLDNFWSLGVAICYDLRFPEQFGEMKRRGANIFALPAAFTERTGRAHWELLVRARAVENQAYVIAANQCGVSGVARYGHSMIVDPWGTVIAQAGEKPGVIYADLDASFVQEVRKILG